MKKVIDFLIRAFVYVSTHHTRLKWDKLAHFYTGAIGFTLFETIFGDIIASIIVVSVAILKEITDAFKKERVSEFADAFMTSLPVGLYWIITLF